MLFQYFQTFFSVSKNWTFPMGTRGLFLFKFVKHIFVNVRIQHNATRCSPHNYIFVFFTIYIFAGTSDDHYEETNIIKANKYRECLRRNCE